MEFVSPLPRKWSEIYISLLDYWENELSPDKPKPPIALVLNGWNYTSDYDKKQKWLDTVKWAKENNCIFLIPELKEEDKYYVDELTFWYPGKYSNWNDKPRKKPEQVELKLYLTKLLESWPTLIGKEFGKNTQPIKFTGKKRRRLLVSYHESYTPPWGSWTNSLSNSGSPNSFTSLRKRVNEIINPHEVDHIDFTQQ